jgi:hypothetical protein
MVKIGLWVCGYLEEEEEEEDGWNATIQGHQMYRAECLLRVSNRVGWEAARGVFV